MTTSNLMIYLIHFLLCVAFMICTTLNNTHTHRNRQP